MTSEARVALAFLLVSFCSVIVGVQGKHINIVVPDEIAGAAAVNKRHKRDVEVTEEKKPEIYSLGITSSIAARFAHTVIVSKILNKASTSREALFTVQLPDSAFISNFSMTIDDVTYVGQVKEKNTAEKEYKKAKKRGQSAGHVSAKPRATNTFKVAVNVAAGSKISFELTYQEMLQRRLGVYEHRISIRPGQVVKRLRIDVFITEPQELEFVHVSPIISNVVDTWNIDGSVTTPATINQESDTRAHVSYYPTEDEQRGQSPEGINGDLIVRYDVKHDASAGEIQVLNGYFVHYFAPSDLPPVQKNVVFVIDVSGSMSGTKISQTKQSLKVILDDMRSFDRFNILTFSYDVTFWKKNTMVLATPTNVKDAKAYVKSLEASGGTNFNSGLVDAANLLRNVTDNAESNERSAFLIIMLTDGNPSSGVTNPADIQTNAETAIDGKYSLFCLGFGNDVDFKFLQKLSLENQGIGRRIYEDSDANLQLKGFYDEVATPLLFDVDIQYPGGNVDINTVTQSTFRNYFNGSEIVVAGKLVDDNTANLVASVVANGADSEIEFIGEFSPVETPSSLLKRHVPDDFVQRLWAYLTIKELLRKRVLTTDPAMKESLTEEALELSLKYNFVTPLTSMIVVKPEVPETNQAEGETKEGDGAADKDTATPSPTSKPIPPPTRRTDKAKYRKKSRRRGGGRSYAYGDPHFVVDLPDGNDTLCFNINGEEDEIFTLVSDPVIGLYVNARLIGDGKTKEGTYIGDVGIVLDFEGKSHYIRVTTTTIALDSSYIFPWKPLKLRFANFALRVGADLTFTLSYGSDIVLVLHKVKRRSPNPDYFGFYIEDGRGFSKLVHGLIGQFHAKNISIINKENDVFDPGYQQAEVKVGDRTVEVFENYRKNEKTNERVQCWFAHNNARGVIDGKRSSYIVHELFYRKFTRP